MAMKVLVVDDEMMICEWLQFCISQNPSCELTGVAHNGAEALEIFRGNEADLVLTDIKMPVMDGHRLTKLVKTDEVLQDIPIVIFSSIVNDEMRLKGEQLGADYQLSKPEIGQLVGVIDELLEKEK